MNEPLRVLVVEDSENDALLLMRTLRNAGFDPTYERVETPTDLLRALDEPWDAVLSDYSMPQFNALDALAITRGRQVDIPFIVISGTVGEEVAVATMRLGAHDYLMKGNLTRLGEAIRREMAAARVREQQRASERRVRHLNTVLHAIRNVNQLIVREQDPARMVELACREMVATRGFSTAWVYLTRDAPGGPVVVESGWGSRMDALLAALAKGELPDCCRRALEAPGATMISNPRSFCGACRMCAISDGSTGAAAALVTALRKEGLLYGFLCVSVSESQAAEEEEERLLSEVGEDISFALRSIETERRREQSERTLRAIFESASDGILLIDSSTQRIVAGNPAMCRMLGRTLAELESLSIDEIYPQPDCHRRLAQHEQLVTTPAALAADLPIRRKDGTVFPAEVTGACLELEGREHVLSIFRDVTARREAEQALRASEAKYRELYDEAPHAYFTVSAEDATILDCNRAAGELLREGPAAIKGKAALSLFAEDALCRELADNVLEQLKGGGAVENAELQMKRADGSTADVSLSIAPKRDASGRVAEGRAVAIDITERKRLQAQVAQSDRLASMGMLAAGVAHEINNPLAYVLYNLETLSDEMPRFAKALRRWDRAGQVAREDDELSGIAAPDRALLSPSTLDDMAVRFKDALHGVYQIRDTARGLRSFSRVDPDRLVPVELPQAIDTAIRMVTNEVKYRAKLVRDYGKAPAVIANDGRLAQVFLNLMINAVHAIPEGDVEHNEIRVRTWRQGDEVLAEVRDTGKGIAEAHLPHVFEAFFTTKPVGVGTGLGLPISKSIVEGYGGRIEVSSTVGVGTAFVVHLPVPKTDALARSSDQARDATTPATPVRGRLLIVDDEPAVRMVLRRMLGAEHEVVEAGSGREAKALLEQDTNFDVVLCDLMMPDVSGIDLHAWLSTENAVLAGRVVFMTGGVFTPKASEYVSRIRNVRVEKPFDISSMKELVDMLVAATKAAR